MRILVTGGAGFIGSHLCSRLLLEEKNEVICVDNFFTGQKSNIRNLILNYPDRFELIRHDVTIPLYLEVDQIYNLACPASPIHYQRDPVQTTKTSVHGAINMLGLAKRTDAKIFQASTSEVYGDPQVHPQREDYWGNVNPIGVRSCYDEGKRCAETLFFDYYREHKTRIKVARIFNSLTGDQKVIYYKNGILKHRIFSECYEDIKDNIKDVLVPCFDQNSKYSLRQISAVHKHNVTKDGYELKLTWGKKIKLTEDHGVFVQDKNKNPIECFVRDLKVGDKIAVPNRLEFLSIPLLPFKISSILKEDFNFYLINDEDLETIVANQKWVEEKRKQSPGFPSVVEKFKKIRRVKSSFTKENNILLKNDNWIVCDDSKKIIKNNIENINNFLWFLGFYVAEGSLVEKYGNYEILFHSDVRYLEKLRIVVKDLFGLDVIIKDVTTLPHISVASKIIFNLVTSYFQFGVKKQLEKIIPEWVIQLPNDQLKWFLHGFWEGDGNHSAKSTGNQLIFGSSSKELIDSINLILLKFGIVGSTCEFYPTCSKEDPRKFKTYSITIQDLDDYNILNLDNVIQKLQCQKTNNIQWAHVLEIKHFELINEDVYDFSVENFENFVGGDLITCHNTYGPNMHPKDGRVVSNFIVQALTNQPITVYGLGDQTRSFCYVTDTVDAIMKLMDTEDDFTGPMNIGNPVEFTMIELAKEVIRLTGSKSKIVHQPLPTDDPRQRKPDIDLAKTMLSWEPKVNLENGLIDTIQYFKGLSKK